MERRNVGGSLISFRFQNESTSVMKRAKVRARFNEKGNDEEEEEDEEAAESEISLSDSELVFDDEERPEEFDRRDDDEDLGGTGALVF